jgi:coproporphyrinogen III oxidase
MTGQDEIAGAFRSVHDRISAFLSAQDGSHYAEDVWDYERGTGGGVTRTWEQATLIEKGGVNFSAIHGSSLPSSAATQLKVAENTPFFATGVSLVIHPHNPHVPTIHMNVRFFQAGEVWWFGGGVDLTPYYPVKSQVVQFHKRLKTFCEEHAEPYAEHKKMCDEYFYLPHREEMRGVGGIFFDHLRSNRERNFAFARDLGLLFPELYAPFISEDRDKRFSEEQRAFQLYRRSRYVEFNLLYDRGTKFGLQSGGRTESILMSLPAVANWRYSWKPSPGTPESELTEFYLKPQNWAGMD